MTVAELIRILETHPPELRVMVLGYEEGYDDLEADCVVGRDQEARTRFWRVSNKWSETVRGELVEL